MTYGETDGDSEAQRATLVHAQVVETLQWNLRLLFHQDQAGAALHTSIVQFSPLTFATAQALHTIMEYQPLEYWPDGAKEMVEQVLSHLAFDSPTFKPLI